MTQTQGVTLAPFATADEARALPAPADLADVCGGGGGSSSSSSSSSSISAVCELWRALHVTRMRGAAAPLVALSLGAHVMHPAALLTAVRAQGGGWGQGCVKGLGCDGFGGQGCWAASLRAL